jgi:ATP-dependent DNA ligase
LTNPIDPVRLSPVLTASATQVVEAAGKLGLEGVIGKRRESIYEPGQRSGAWIKQRINNQQEFVVGGYIPGAQGFDALLVGVYGGKSLLFAAIVRNGFVPRDREELFPGIKRLATAGCPFANLPGKKASRWGTALTAEKMLECRWVTAEARRPSSICGVD